jgi:PBP1b-binding outer membrane lipoprotein LpoB
MKLPRIPIIAILALALLLPGCTADKTRAAAESAVDDFHQRLDKGDFETLYTAAHPEFKAATTEKDFLAYLAALHGRLGAIQQTAETDWTVDTLKTDARAKLVYQTKFSGGDAVETFLYEIDGDRALLCAYHIDSPALETK